MTSTNPAYEAEKDKIRYRNIGLLDAIERLAMLIEPVPGEPFVNSVWAAAITERSRLVELPKKEEPKP